MIFPCLIIHHAFSAYHYHMVRNGLEKRKGIVFPRGLALQSKICRTSLAQESYENVLKHSEAFSLA